ncbi:MAG: FeoB-associated Cys-rich membrane protein [Provencibacterium sp.]|nr:FeoB-associated Cys-rich membrane protein [Provencibacterium sp.]
MPSLLGYGIVLAVLTAAAVLAVRSLWKGRKRDGGCCGGCRSK